MSAAGRGASPAISRRWATTSSASTSRRSSSHWRRPDSSSSTPTSARSTGGTDGLSTARSRAWRSWTSTTSPGRWRPPPRWCGRAVGSRGRSSTRRSRASARSARAGRRKAATSMRAGGTPAATACAVESARTTDAWGRTSTCRWRPGSSSRPSTSRPGPARPGHRCRSSSSAAGGAGRRYQRARQGRASEGAPQVVSPKKSTVPIAGFWRTYQHRPESLFVAR